jgi:peptidoglycan/xylan/chitin deacetylase (PgdA/CDA1 family)
VPSSGSRPSTQLLPQGRRCKAGAGPLTFPLVLSYHAVSDDWPAALAVTPADLDAQLRLLVARGYRGATFEAIATGRARGRVVAVTFDDAFASVFELARPILGRAGLPGTVFVPTGFAGGEQLLEWPGIDGWRAGPHRGELRPMDWDDLGRLAAEGWEVGSHTVTHPRLTALDDEALREELVGSKAACEAALNRPCATIAYPYGDHDRRVVAAAAAAGYVGGCTLPARTHRATPLRWPRVGVYREDGMARFRVKVAPAVRRARRSRGWAAVEAAQRAVLRVTSP